MNNFIKAEDKGRTIFHNLFHNFFKKLVYSEDEFCFWDSSGVTFTNKKKVTEIKRRHQYFFEDYSGSTIAEEHKITEFQKLQDQHSYYNCHYMCLYRDHWVSYNLTNRFAVNSPDLELFERNLPISTVQNKGYRDKKVCYLKFDLQKGDKYGNYGA